VTNPKWRQTKMVTQTKTATYQNGYMPKRRHTFFLQFVTRLHAYLSKQHQSLLEFLSHWYYSNNVYTHLSAMWRHVSYIAFKVNPLAKQ